MLDLGSPGLKREDNAPAMAAVGILSDLSYSTRGSRSGDLSSDMETANVRIPTAKYTKMGETLRHVIPGHMQCSMACGGKACKYENPSRWSDEEQAIKGLYSSWITDNLLAMARPSTEIMDKYNIIQQFQRCGLKTVINLQRPGEHASCGNPLEPESGFTYLPERFMEAGVYYYNFGWKDYGVASLTTILDMVKVMAFAVQEGKMAVHCHAGLGRTGVLLACYLVFTCRMSADQAILFVRAKRPNSIQTRGQLLCVREFAQFLVPLRSVFSCAEPKSSAVTLSQYLTRQRHLLHGYEARQMKNVPKVVQLVCRLLIDIAANRQVMVEEGWLEIPDLTAEVEKTVSQQALQLLGKEMRGKGIPVPGLRPVSPVSLQITLPQDQPLISDNELDPLWRQENVQTPLRSCLSNTRSFSYSDSVLHKPTACSKPLNHKIKRSLSHCCLKDSRFSSQDLSSFFPNIGSPFLDQVFDGGRQSFPAEHSDRRESHCHTREGLLSTKNIVESTVGKPDEVAALGTEHKAAPLLNLQSELSPESRCLLVAKALSMDLIDNHLAAKVSAWQTELNSREGAWERLCLERDPLVLSAVMWSWLEQLREPVISWEDVKSLTEKNVNPQSALDLLDKGHRFTLLCILDCAAQVLPEMPEEVELGFLHQTIKVFTRMDSACENKYSTLRTVLTPTLHKLRRKAAEEQQDSRVSL
ncbi:protein tyrosine phosphatase domain-containing protein 1 isoform 1-T1 [Synchiropus picturatus]